ncbi:MAG: hypothetical protein OXE53_18415 [Deltaproteobacteria bacterium]|nr:hypothetical protein [Deltaproteobacteria bacterium]
MTRFASILGVATVATLVLLSGCESATKTDTDYAKKLEGTWNGTIEHPVGEPGATVPGSSMVRAEVSRTGTNQGAVSLTISTGPVGVTDETMIVTNTVSGSIEVTATEIMVSDVSVVPPNPAIAQALADGLTLTYDLSDDESEVTVGNAVLFPALLGPTNSEITLTKQMAGDG